jgi:putative addiction module killer protein
MQAIPKSLRLYRTREGKEPFAEFFQDLRDEKGKTAITKRLDRVRQGNLGYFDKVGAGVLELKVDVGPGYRVYIGMDGQELVILLCGGDKQTQKRKDIEVAQEYWGDYKKRKY